MAKSLVAIAMAAGVWALLSWWSRRALQRELGLLGHRYRIPAPPLETSLKAAAQRRAQLVSFLTEFREGAIPFEFIEVPPSIESVIERRPFSREFTEEAGFWHISRLSLQVNRTQLLLLERVTDALICLHRANLISEKDFPVRVEIEKVPAHTEGLPWRVLIASLDPTAILRHLTDDAMRDWLAIGVHVIEASPSRRKKEPPEETPTPPRTPDAAAPASGAAAALGRCTMGADGLEGTIGGVLDDSSCPPVAVICRHVLSSNCASLIWPSSTALLRPREFTSDVPDAAFIRPDTCFAQRQNSEAAVLVGSQADIEIAAELRKRVRKNSDNLNGVVMSSCVSGFRLGNHFYRGPHFQVVPWFVKRFGIIWPLRRRFSQPGDSGCWIIDSETRQWIGMIIGGFQSPNNLTVAISAEHIVDAFSRQHFGNAHPGVPKMIVTRAFVR